MSKRSGSVSAPRLAMKRNSPTSGNDLSVAIQTLDEDTMIQACSLLLSERDYQDDVVEEESDYSKLITLFVKCNDAGRVVERHAAQHAPSGLPSLNASIPPPTSATMTPSARAAAAAARSVKVQGQLNSMKPPRRMPMAQMSRPGPGVAASRMKGAPSAPLRPTLKRVPSDSSLASITSTSSNRSAAKKTRLLTGAALPDTNSKGTAPPPEALNFLQALNNQHTMQEEDSVPLPTLEIEESNARAAKTDSSIKPQIGKRHSPRKRG
jgi:hypothetical protein